MNNLTSRQPYCIVRRRNGAEQTNTEEGGKEGSEGRASEGSGEGAESSERVIGLDLERPGIAAATAAVTVPLAGVALWCPDVRAFWVIVAFGLLFAVLDVREALHQREWGRTSVMAMAIMLAVIHVAAAALAAIRARRP